MTNKQTIITNLSARIELLNRIYTVENNLNRIAIEYNNLPSKQLAQVIGFEKFRWWKGVVIVFFLGAIYGQFSEIIINATRVYGINVTQPAFHIFLELLVFPTAVASTLLICVWWMRSNKKKIRLIQDTNAEIQASNTARRKELAIRENGLKQNINQLTQQYTQLVRALNLGNDYNVNYDALTFFHKDLSTGFADTLKEALQNYRQHKHQQRMELGQQEMVKQQKINNIFAGISMAANIATAFNTADIAANTADIAESSRRTADNMDYVTGRGTRSEER